MATSIIRKASGSMESATFTGKGMTIRCYRIGNVVNVNISDTSATSAISAGATILTLGARYCPNYKQTFYSALVTTSGASPVRMMIEADGKLHTIGTSIASGEYLRFSFTYLAND